MRDIDLNLVKYYKKNDFYISTFEYQFTEKVMRIFMNGEYKKTVYYKDIHSCKLANYDDVMIFLFTMYNKKRRFALIVDKEEDRGLINFLSDKLF